MSDLTKAKELLIQNRCTCVLCKDEQTHLSHQRGVKPLVLWLESGMDFAGFSAADKVIGKATAFLYVLLGIRNVYAKVISRPALEVLGRYNIFVLYDAIADNIINRQGDGICPFEQAVLDTDEADKAYELICIKLIKLCGSESAKE